MIFPYLGPTPNRSLLNKTPGLNFVMNVKSTATRVKFWPRNSSDFIITLTTRASRRVQVSLRKDISLQRLKTDRKVNTPGSMLWWASIYCREHDDRHRPVAWIVMIPCKSQLGYEWDDVVERVVTLDCLRCSRSKAAMSLYHRKSREIPLLEIGEIGGRRGPIRSNGQMIYINLESKRARGT